MECDPKTCQYHALTESVIQDLKEAVFKLTEGQEMMRDHVIQLTEAFKAFDRIDRRLEKLEEVQRQKDTEQDRKIQELRGFMYKVSGGVIVLVSVATFIVNFLGVIG